MQWRENDFCLHLWRIEIHVKLEMCGVPQKKNKSCSYAASLRFRGSLMSALPWQSVSSPILILNLRLLKVQPGHELSREPFIRAVRV